MNSNSLYPSSPSTKTEGYTSLPSSYVLKAILAIMAILLFFVLYFALVIALGYLVRWSIFYDIGEVNKITILGKLGAIAGSIMLFVFTLKFIFKLKNHRPANRIKLVEKEHPDLWKFVDKICKETGAPKPKSIFVDPDVNAYVSYTNSWLSLFLPVKKELTIGLGLVSCLNLSEFKAVISHEFGHFAQSTMKVGSYIMSANTIIHDMIFNRDSWDVFLDNWRASDIRISFAAWIITPVIWSIRQVLNLFYKFLNVMYSSLSREMEFNADRVAASTSGSDAIISALWRLDDGAMQWNESLNNLYNASRKQMFVDNVYLHHEDAMTEIKDAQRDKLNALDLHPAGGKQYFTGSELSKVSMYASHPPNDMREENVKKPYLACDSDDRSPWLLFASSEKIQKSATQLVYQQYFNVEPINYTDTKTYISFINNETKGKRILAKYDNVFEQRFVTLPNTISDDIKSKSSEQLLKDIKGLEQELQLIMQPINEIDDKLRIVQQIAEGTSKLKSFEYDGKTYGKNDLESGYQVLLNKRNHCFENNFKDWDDLFFASNMELAVRTQSGEKVKKLIAQHIELSRVFKTLIDQKDGFLNELHNLQSKDEVRSHEVAYLTKLVKESAVQINAAFTEFGKIKFMPLSNLDTLDECLKILLPKGELKPPYGNIFENGTFDQYAHELDQTRAQLLRIEQMNMAEILLEFEHVKNNL